MFEIFRNSGVPENRLIAGSSPLAERLANPLVLAGLTMLGNLSPSAEPINVMKGVPQAMLAGVRLQKELERRQAAWRTLRRAGFGAPGAQRSADSDRRVAPGAGFRVREIAPAEAELTARPRETAVPDVASDGAFRQVALRIEDDAPPRADEIGAARPEQPLYRKGQTATDWSTGERRVFDGQRWVPQ